jgi:hypothetical protein
VAKREPIIWSGKTGVMYRYWLANVGAAFEDTPGNFMLLRETVPGQYTPLYIGEAESLEHALNSIDAGPGVAAALEAGATKVCSHATAGGEIGRRIEARDLIAAYDPPVNLESAA